MLTHSKRRFPAFSIRTLLIAMTLLCAYAACWRPTMTQGVKDVWKFVLGDDESANPEGCEAVAPLVVTLDVWEVTSSPFQTEYKRSYFFWCFGYVVKLPFEQKLADEASEAIEDGGQTLPSTEWLGTP